MSRASLHNLMDREALLAHPEAISLPIQQITDGRVLVAEQDGRIRGFSVILPRHDGSFELDGLFVEPDCWRQGIGRSLVDHSSVAAMRAGAKHLHVVGNPGAKHFYIACGFQALGTTRTRFGVGLLMRKPLS